MLFNLNVFINVVFLIECVTKILAFGFVAHEGAYLRDAWSCLDFFIVLTSLVDTVLRAAGHSPSTNTTLKPRSATSRLVSRARVS